MTANTHGNGNGHAKPPRMITIYAEEIMLPDGTLVRRPICVAASGEFVDVAEAAKILGLSNRQVRHLCDVGQIKSAHKPGAADGVWRMNRGEILRRLTLSGG